MMRKELESKMKANNISSIVIVMNENDPLGVACTLKGGFLYDAYTGRRVDRNADIWGLIHYVDGKPVRRKFKEVA